MGGWRCPPLFVTVALRTATLKIGGKDELGSAGACAPLSIYWPTRVCIEALVNSQYKLGGDIPLRKANLVQLTRSDRFTFPSVLYLNAPLYCHTVNERTNKLIQFLYTYHKVTRSGYHTVSVSSFTENQGEHQDILHVQTC